MPSARHASPLLWEHRISRWLARQLSYDFEQSALQIKMKDFATYTTLKREAMEFDEVRIRWQNQLVTRVRRSHTGPCNAHPLQTSRPPSCAIIRCGSVSLPPQAACDLISVRMYNDDSKHETYITAALSSKVREYNCIQSVLFGGRCRWHHPDSSLRRPDPLRCSAPHSRRSLLY